VEAKRNVTFRVMGCMAHVVIVGGAPELERMAQRRLNALEAKWSRFIADSEVSRLNRAGGAPCRVSADTFELIERAAAAWAATGGAFDPTVLPAVIAAGYDRSYEDVAADGDAAEPVTSPGCAGIRLDRQTRLIILPPSVAIDPGGIGKGLAADIVVRDLLAAGADGACVNVGGDVRVEGVGPEEGDTWIVAVEDPRDATREMDRYHLSAGAVASSSTLLRTWVRGGVPMHHLIDPASGAPARTGAIASTVVAGEAWWAEALTKAALIAGDEAPQILDHLGTPGFVVMEDGRVLESSGLDRLRPARPVEVSA
jgi:FAD:protein FMN transferase